MKWSEDFGIKVFNFGKGGKIVEIMNLLCDDKSCGGIFWVLWLAHYRDLYLIEEALKSEHFKFNFFFEFESHLQIAGARKFEIFTL